MEEQQAAAPKQEASSDPTKIVVPERYLKTQGVRLPRDCIHCGGKMKTLTTTTATSTTVSQVLNNAEEVEDILEHFVGLCNDCGRLVEFFSKSPGYVAIRKGLGRLENF